MKFNIKFICKQTVPSLIQTLIITLLTNHFGTHSSILVGEIRSLLDFSEPLINPGVFPLSVSIGDPSVCLIGDGELIFSAGVIPLNAAGLLSSICRLNTGCSFLRFSDWLTFVQAIWNICTLLIMSSILCSLSS